MKHLLILLTLILPLGLWAQELADDTRDSSTTLDTVRILGVDAEAEMRKPHSAYIIRKDTVEQQQQTDANRLLKQVPGVYVQEEDGLGLRPNIGLRGTHPHRSRKVVLLEDGILIGPAPYSAPAAYYVPFMSRVESLEVFKGVASVPYGPNSIGGAVNYITRSLPAQNTREIELSGGDFGFQKYRTLLSHSVGDHGLMVEASRVQTKGFKQIDLGDTSGFQKNDVLVKGKHKISAHLNQELSWKLGYADEDSDETYLGLTLDDFYKNPYRRYAASQEDEMIFGHRQYQATYTLSPSDTWGTWVTAYYHEFNRNWERLNGFSGGSAPSISDVLKDPTAPANQLFYRVLTGVNDSADGDGSNLVRANNNRYFFSQGLQWSNVLLLDQGDLSHQIKTTLRFHQDQIRRRHTESTFLMRSGRLERSAAADAQATTNNDTSTATTLAAEDEITAGAWKFSGHFRYENVSYESANKVSGLVTSRDENAFVPGIGALYSASENWSGFIGLNEGVTLVGPSTTESTKPEKSVNLEAGLRYQNPDAERFFEAIYFRADYSNIKGTCSFSSGCASNQLDQEFDGGKALIQGFEGRIAQMFTFGKVFMPVSLNLTLTQAQFAAEAVSSNPEWGSGTNFSLSPGDPLPYVPEANYSLNIGTQVGRYSQEFVLLWNGQMYDQASAAGREVIPAHGVVDWSGRYQLSDAGLIYARVDNLFDNAYLVSLRPFGARPGKDRSFQVGLKYRF